MIEQVWVSVFLLVCVLTVKSTIYLSHTNDALEIESYDCVRTIRSSLDYCRSPREPIDLSRDNHPMECEQNGGQRHRFSELRSRNINISTILHQWRSSLERIEDYLRYRKDSSQSDGWVCQCLHEGSFGKNCEYRLPVGETIEEILHWQLIMRKENPWKVQIYGDVLCYETLECDSGVLCLDWREICDGIQQCLEGKDEENCDLLEMNPCDPEEEYRCSNGMCIADEFFLDGERDCLDWSDEMEFQSDHNCPMESVSEECDDHLCLPNFWSCGDGECIDGRLDFQTRSNSPICQSGRNEYFICETHMNQNRWTMPNGRCVDVGSERYEESSAVNRSEVEQCSYLLKCSLSRGGEKGCLCERDLECIDQLEKVCSSSFIRYPDRSIVAPFLFFLFNNTNNRKKKQPDVVLINGTVRCGDSLITVIEKIIPFTTKLNARQATEEYFCRPFRNKSRSELARSLRDRCHQANESTDRCEEWNPCLSITRFMDGWWNCLDGRDEDGLTSTDIEKSCARVRRHRFRCSAEEVTCFSVFMLGNYNLVCKNAFNLFWFGDGAQITSTECNQQMKDDCSLLRQYIDLSWREINTSEIRLERRIPFRRYCDTFWDLPTREDENLHECRYSWICLWNQPRCKTGQCLEERWFNDGEWDCSDASEEHNSNSAIRPVCPNSHPVLCLSFNATQQNLSCLDLGQVGDGLVHCLGATDERNTLQHCNQSSSMLGSSFRCLSTNTCIPFHLHCFINHRCPVRSDDEYWCDRQHQQLNFSHLNGFTCFDARVKSNRCNQRRECPFGEDEYMCDYARLYSSISTREEKQFFRRMKQQIVELPVYPNGVNFTQLDFNFISTIPPATNLSSSSSSSLSPYWCNRGLGVLSKKNDSIVCFCPPQYVGEKCEYHQDRLSVLLYLNLSQSIDSSTIDSLVLLKLRVLFLFNNEILMSNQFHLHSSFESTTSKLHTHFPYPHSFSSREQRRERFYNRSDLLFRHPYSIRIELYRTRRQEDPSLIAVWKYPVLFDYLPVLRLAKVLHLTESFNNRNPCSSQPCHPNEQCQQLMNNESQYICLCKTNFTGENCSIKDLQCANGYCAFGSLCQPDARGSLREGSSAPFCLCPLNRYGQRCFIEYDVCLSNPCLNDGSCFPDSQPNQFICHCTKRYLGPRCQWKRSSIDLSLSIKRPYRGAVIQYFRIDLISLDLILVGQQAFGILPEHVEYFQTDLKTTLPDIVLAKVYSSHEDLSPVDLYLLSVHIRLKLFSVNGATQISLINQCEHIRTFSNESSPIRYHQICIRNRTRLCFRDDVYLCLCGVNHSRVECFFYDDQLDRCKHCLSQGRCLKGNHRRSADFVCLCPPCHSGDQCQFDTKSFSFTLDQLFSPDFFSDQKQTTISLLIFFSLFLFILALPNNVFSFITVRRRPCLRYGIGHYLLWMSIINQLNLLFFVARLSHLIVKISDTSSSSSSSSSMLDDFLCKSLNYFLTCFTRLVYWLTSLISIERVYMTIFVNGQWLKKPRIARRLILFIFVVVFLTDLYEVFFYRSLSNPASGQGSICVLEISKSDRTLWMTFHLVFLLLNSLLPFLINLSSTITIILIIVKKKMKTSQNNTTDQAHRSLLMSIRRRFRLIVDVVSENKEFVVGPAITLVPQLFSLPLFISSFIFNCQNLENSWLRHFLIVSYWISLTPQCTSFFLYISHSSFYSSEWHKTNIGRWIDELLHRHSSSSTTTTRTRTAFTALSATQDILKDKH